MKEPSDSEQPRCKHTEALTTSKGVTQDFMFPGLYDLQRSLNVAPLCGTCKGLSLSCELYQIRETVGSVWTRY